MLTVEDNKIRTVDAALEVLARGLGQAVLDRHSGFSIDEIAAGCPSLKSHQRGLFSTPLSDPSTMLNIAIDKAEKLGVESSEFHKLRMFRNKVTHKHASGQVSSAALDSAVVHTELSRAAAVLERIGCSSEQKLVRRYLAYYMSGAPEGKSWSDMSEDEVRVLVAQKPPKPPRRKTRAFRAAGAPIGRLSSDQAEAIVRVKAWWGTPSRRFVISGPAGTGKTRLIPELVEALGLQPSQIQLVAPTNKACDVLRSKLSSGRGFRGRVSTFHKLLYRYQLPPEADGEDLRFVVRGLKQVVEGVKLVVCDEASMLTDFDVASLEAGYRTLYLGDAAQLPPVLEGREDGGRKACAATILERPDAELTTIHRQSGSSSILEAAEIVRSGETLQPTLWDDDATHVLDEAQGHIDRSELRDLLKTADAVLVARNVTRIRVNEMIRELRGHVRHPGDWLPKPGELLVSTDKISGTDGAFVGQPEVSNGQQLVVDRVVRTGMTLNRTTNEEVPFVVVQAHFRDDPDTVGVWQISQEMLVGRHIVGDQVSTRLIAGPRSGLLRCDWGYALTVHKAQGSEWGRVVVIDHGAYDRVGARQWNYVALTRAVKAVTVVRLQPRTTLLA